MNVLHPNGYHCHETATTGISEAPTFLDTLRETGKVVAACKVAGISRNSVYMHYRRYGRFRRKWDRALEVAWEVRGEAACQNVIMELERRGWFARLWTSKPEFEKRLREIEARLRATI